MERLSRSGTRTTFSSSASCVPPPNSQRFATAVALCEPAERLANRYSSAAVGFGTSSLPRKLLMIVDLPACFEPTMSSSVSSLPALEPLSSCRAASTAAKMSVMPASLVPPPPRPTTSLPPLRIVFYTHTHKNTSGVRLQN
eukprot:scaffold147842_cov38-Tisochrysis_lutea.AAC.1